MANSFLDKTGLTYLWGKIVALVNRKQDALTFDSTPTDNSTNPVTSGGVKAYVDANAGGSGDSPVESGSGVGSVQTKAYTVGSSTFTQTASGQGAFAEGSNTVASGMHSHAEGYYTTAQGANQHVEGKFNVIDTNDRYAHITGIGTSATARKNGFTVDWQGNGVFAGSVQAGANPSYDNDLTTKQYVDSKVYMAIDERNVPVTLRTRYDEDYGANVLYGYLPSIYEETNIFANSISLTDSFRYIYEYIDASDNTITIPLTKAILYNSGNYMQKLIFGNGEAAFVDLPSGVMVPEAEWHGD